MLEVGNGEFEGPVCVGSSLLCIIHLHIPTFSLLLLICVSNSSTTTFTLHHPLVCILPGEVYHFTNCSNIYCTLKVPHIYYYNIVESWSEGIPSLLLQHFQPDHNLFPNNIQYQVIEVLSVLLEHECQAYIAGYGVVQLLKVAVNSTRRSKEQNDFQCIQEEEVIIAEVAARKEWCGVSISFADDIKCGLGVVEIPTPTIVQGSIWNNCQSQCISKDRSSYPGS